MPCRGRSVSWVAALEKFLRWAKSRWTESAANSRLDPFQTIVHRQFSANYTADLLAVAVDSEVIAQWQSQVYEIGDLPILDLLQTHLPR